MKSLIPQTIAPPFARYAHGAVSDPGASILVTSGQLGLAADGTIPDSTQAQAQICFANIDAILTDAGARRSDVLRINAFVTDRAHMAGYMAARDAWLAEVTTLPASTLVIVAGFTRPEFTVEIEVTAQAPSPT
ncbi:RidA family protein [Cognatishimia sp. MH4019]|uniref:RidA family protein n=1 Tax=Cognatishimia sp. MH4019 TaxID=2854030 RepID=UPI001CD81A9B|nr:RidA family protein [Cognatishimia sp. MH4019]